MLYNYLKEVQMTYEAELPSCSLCRENVLHGGQIINSRDFASWLPNITIRICAPYFDGPVYQLVDKIYKFNFWLGYFAKAYLLRIRMAEYLEQKKGIYVD